MQSNQSNFALVTSKLPINEEIKAMCLDGEFIYFATAKTLFCFNNLLIPLWKQTLGSRVLYPKMLSIPESGLLIFVEKGNVGESCLRIFNIKLLKMLNWSLQCKSLLDVRVFKQFLIVFQATSLDIYLISNDVEFKQFSIGRLEFEKALVSKHCVPFGEYYSVCVSKKFGLMAVIYLVESQDTGYLFTAQIYSIAKFFRGYLRKIFFFVSDPIKHAEFSTDLSTLFLLTDKGRLLFINSYTGAPFDPLNFAAQSINVIDFSLSSRGDFIHVLTAKGLMTLDLANELLLIKNYDSERNGVDLGPKAIASDYNNRTLLMLGQGSISLFK
jgi:hypothetical protein